MLSAFACKTMTGFACFAMNADSGRLTPRAELAAAGGPSVAFWRRITLTARAVH
jgi:hypothetical protein